MMGQNLNEADLTRVWIGTSGYSFADWVGPFYPAGTSSARMLEFYASVFNTVEVNFTYYRLPVVKTSRGMVDKTPGGFQFVVKAHQSFTHERDLKDKAAFLDGIAPMREAGKLSGLLFQFPQSFKNTGANREYLARVAEEFQGYVSAVEFRDASWAVQPVYRFLDERGLIGVSVDEPEISTLFPRHALATGAAGYVRFHSRDGKKWYQGAQQRYDYNYRDNELKEWVSKILTISERSKNVFVYFNNCHQGQAADNAKTMKRLIREAGLATE
jgi:uncharacterized protein YecE (DUF72 family)